MAAGFSVLKVFLPATAAFLIGVGITPILTHFLYRYKMWKPKAGKTALDGSEAAVFNELHHDREVGTPRFGGVVVWGSLFLTAGLFAALAYLFPQSQDIGNLAFISRSQTWLPFLALGAGALVGLSDDWGEVCGQSGLSLIMRLCVVAAISGLCASWFFFKLGVDSVSIPFMASALPLGALFIPFFICVALFIYAGGVIDGIDGLAGGLFATIFIAYAGIALYQTQYDLAAFCAALSGGLLAFVWFNIPPARFYLSETGTMGLTLALTVVAFLADADVGGRGVSVLPIIALPLVATVLSNLLQIFWKRVFGRKLFRIAPLHHHFEALGWPPYKVTMRYWIVGIIAAIIGVTIAIL